MLFQMITTRLKIHHTNEHDDEDEDNLYLFELLRHISTFVTIYHLEVDDPISFDLLCRILLSLSQLDSLKVEEISSNPLEDLDFEGDPIERSLINNSKISKMNLEPMTMPQLLYLMIFSPALIYVKFDYLPLNRSHLWLDSTFKFHLDISPRLRIVSFFVPSADDRNTNR